MPTYQYSCNDCGHFHEIFQSFSDDSLTVCPECGGRLRKVFNAVGVVFKGSGFYRNDSREKVGSGNGAETKAATNGSGKGAGSDSGSDSGSGSKSGSEKAASSAKSDASSGGSSSTTAPAPA